MSDKFAKDLRKQIRNIVVEALPQALANEMGAAIAQKIHKDVLTYSKARLEEFLQKEVKSQLEVIDKRQTELMEKLKSLVESHNANLRKGDSE